jgi:hypothetical protein
VFVLARTITYATIFIGFILVFLPARLLSWSGVTKPPSIGVAQGMGMLVAGIGATLVLVHDFMDKDLGKAIPYGVYDVTENQGWVSVGIDHDTARFAAEAIRRWWKQMGSKRHRGARELLITADGGGSNGSRCRLWKLALQDLASHLGMPIHVCHFPPGTSKWNKIEHRMFCHITQNWRGHPLVSHEVIINLIANTATQQGLTIQAQLDTATYPTGSKVTDEELARVKLEPAEFHGEWNYQIVPRQTKK